MISSRMWGFYLIRISGVLVLTFILSLGVFALENPKALSIVPASSELVPEETVAVGIVNDNVSLRPLSGVRVSIEGNTATSNSSGAFTIILPQKPGSILFEKEGYRTHTQDITNLPENKKIIVSLVHN